MKRANSILLILVFMLNTMGYYGIFLGMHFKNDRAMLRALEAGRYDFATGVTLEIPLSIPYMHDQSDFQKAQGKFEHRGILYRLIKQKYANDTLTVVCVEDREYQRINGALADYVKNFSDAARDSNPKAKSCIQFIKDYLPLTISLNPAESGWLREIMRIHHNEAVRPAYATSIIHPPNA